MCLEMFNFKSKLLFQNWHVKTDRLNLEIVCILGNLLKININNNILLLSLLLLDRFKNLFKIKINIVRLKVLLF